ncbi:MAG: hypothetical protein GYA46_04620 [candidate division Zixibacteria bacterium]|nr:hypothetical protein [candidate division Zixibacteria bacterium]
MTGGSAAAAGAAAAAAAAARAREEEELLTSYNKEDLEGWEFKIVRSNFGRFSNYENVQKVCQEEARAGWEMIEKFDEYRIRFKRRIDKRSGDRQLDFNPYRTTIGFGEGRIAAIVLIGMAALIAGIIALALYFKDGGHFDPHSSQQATVFIPAILAVICLVALVVIVAIRRR